MFERKLNLVFSHFKKPFSFETSLNVLKCFRIFSSKHLNKIFIF